MKNSQYRQSAPEHEAVKQNYIGGSELQPRTATTKNNKVKKDEKKVNHILIIRELYFRD